MNTKIDEQIEELESRESTRGLIILAVLFFLFVGGIPAVLSSHYTIYALLPWILVLVGVAIRLILSHRTDKKVEKLEIKRGYRYSSSGYDKIFLDKRGKETKRVKGKIVYDE